MKRYIIIGIVTIVILPASIIWYFATRSEDYTYFDQDVADFKKEIEHQYTYSKTSGPESFQRDYALEIKAGIRFPLDEPACAILHFDNFWRSPKKLEQIQMQQLVEFLNDTSTYQWGEVGTPYTDRLVTFHDKIGRCIGLTEISYDGQTKTIPATVKMKWGGLQLEARNKLKKILQDKR